MKNEWSERTDGNGEGEMTRRKGDERRDTGRKKRREKSADGEKKEKNEGEGKRRTENETRGEAVSGKSGDGEKRGEGTGRGTSGDGEGTAGETTTEQRGAGDGITEVETRTEDTCAGLEVVIVGDDFCESASTFNTSLSFSLSACVDERGTAKL